MNQSANDALAAACVVCDVLDTQPIEKSSADDVPLILRQHGDGDLDRLGRFFSGGELARMPAVMANDIDEVGDRAEAAHCRWCKLVQVAAAFLAADALEGVGQSVVGNTFELSQE